MPLTEVVHDRLNVEVFRGCTRGCRFCQAGMITRPVRERPADQVRTMVSDGLRRTGYDEVALTSHLGLKNLRWMSHTGYGGTGGNAVIVLSEEPEKQEAAWKFVTFVTGPEAQSIVVETAGYLPTNRRALGEDYLAAFYEANPNFATAPKQIDRSWPWVGYPGGESVRIWRTQRDLIALVMRGDLSIEEGLEQIVEETEALMR